MFVAPKSGGTKHITPPYFKKWGGTCPPVHPMIDAHGDMGSFSPYQSWNASGAPAHCLQCYNDLQSYTSQTWRLERVSSVYVASDSISSINCGFVVQQVVRLAVRLAVRTACCGLLLWACCWLSISCGFVVYYRATVCFMVFIFYFLA